MAKYRYIVTIIKPRTDYYSGSTFDFNIKNHNATNTAAGTTPTGLWTRSQTHSPAVGGNFNLLFAGQPLKVNNEAANFAFTLETPTADI